MDSNLSQNFHLSFMRLYFKVTREKQPTENGLCVFIFYIHLFFYWADRAQMIIPG